MPNPPSPWWNREEEEKLCIALCYVSEISSERRQPLQLEAARAPTCLQQVGLRSLPLLPVLYLSNNSSSRLPNSCSCISAGKTASSIDYLTILLQSNCFDFRAPGVSSSSFRIGGGKNAKVASAVLHKCLTQKGRKDKQHSLSCTASVGTLQNRLQISQVSS